MLERKINGSHFYTGLLSGYLKLKDDREKINSINLFPVPDGDTGSNMEITLASIVKKVEHAPSLGILLDRSARLSLAGARGNSGIIIAQFITGLSENVGKRKELSVEEFAHAAKGAVSRAYQAVEKPVEGTILTVLKKWADAFSTYSQNKEYSLEEIVSFSFKKAEKALEETKEEMELLKKHKQVDAGAKGFVSFLEGIQVNLKNWLNPALLRKKIGLDIVNIPDEKIFLHSHNSEISERYCTEAYIEGSDLNPPSIREQLKESGSSLIIGGGRSAIRIHIHTNDPAAVFRKLKPFGKLIGQKVDDMKRQNDLVHDRKSDIAIVTDSIADIPLELRDKYQIHMIPQRLIWGDDQYLDRITISPDDFYDMLETRDDVPGSSLPDPVSVELYFRQLASHYKSILVLPVGKKLSGTWQIMKNISQSFEKSDINIAVLDTCLNSAAQALLVLECAQMAIEGIDFESLCQKAEQLKKKTKIFVSVKTFKYMVRGGRVSPLKGFLAKVLNLKPIVSLDEEGKGIAFDKAFSQVHLMKKIEHILKNIKEEKGLSRYIIVHGGDQKRAEEFRASVKKATGIDADYITDISPIVGMHAGRGAVAIGLLEK